MYHGLTGGFYYTLIWSWSQLLIQVNKYSNSFFNSQKIKHGDTVYFRKELNKWKTQKIT